MDRVEKVEKACLKSLDLIVFCIYRKYNPSSRLLSVCVSAFLTAAPVTVTCFPNSASASSCSSSSTSHLASPPVSVCSCPSSLFVKSMVVHCVLCTEYVLECQEFVTDMKINKHSSQLPPRTKMHFLNILRWLVTLIRDRSHMLIRSVFVVFYGSHGIRMLC